MFASSAGYQVKRAYLYDDYGDKLIDVDMVVSETFSVMDFDVNHLCYDVTKNKIMMEGGLSLIKILKNIKDKRACISDDYLVVLTSKSGSIVINDREFDCRCARARVHKRFISNGWQIVNREGEILNFMDENCKLIHCDVSVEPDMPWRKAVVK